jgi:hypothetical protein
VGRRDSRAESELGEFLAGGGIPQCPQGNEPDYRGNCSFVAIPFERELTAAEQDRWDAAQEAAEEAFEHFERVLSEASAFC